MSTNRAFIIVQNSTNNSVHTTSIGGLDLFEARALIQQEYDDLEKAMGESFCDSFTGRRTSATSVDIDNDHHDIPTIVGVPAHIEENEDAVLPSQGDNVHDGQTGVHREDAGHEAPIVDGQGPDVHSDHDVCQDDQDSTISLLKVRLTIISRLTCS